jgi:hypothetical protein
MRPTLRLTSCLLGATLTLGLSPRVSGSSAVATSHSTRHN